MTFKAVETLVKERGTDHSKDELLSYLQMILLSFPFGNNDAAWHVETVEAEINQFHNYIRKNFIL